jgi:uncharacterized protein (TIGR01370 family)
MASEDKAMLAQPATQVNRKRLRRRYLIIGAAIMIVAIALAVGLGVGLTVGRPTGSSDDSSESTSSPIPTGNTSIPAAVWKPTAGLTWDYQLKTALDSTDNRGIDVWDIDVFDNEASTIKALQDQGSKVVCYFSAGSYEDWRDDKDDFEPSDLGNDLDGWAGEKWLNIRSPNVRRIMEARMDVAVEKGCNGVDPDNVDGFDNDNGLDLTEEDSIEYMTFLANAAHSRNLAIGLKNAGTIIPNVINNVEFSVNEQCFEYDECRTFRPFIDQNKPVFHVEYPKGDDTNNNFAVASTEVNSICDDNTTSDFSTIIKNMDLDGWLESCPAASQRK